MRNLAKSYYFTPGTRTITVNSVSLTDKYDIYTIINETQKIVIASSLQMDNIISVNNNVITYSNSLPVLNLGDKIKIEVEQAIQTSTIVNVPGDITVTPIQGQPDYYHDLAYEISQWVDVQYPYCFALLLGKTSKLHLFGASKYKTSDGVIHSSDGVVNIGANEVGRENKTTTFVILRFSTPLPVYTFQTWGTTSITGVLIGVYNYNCLITNLNFVNTKLNFFINDEAVKNPIVYNGVRYRQDLSISQFQSTNIQQYNFPLLAFDATDSEKTVLIGSSCFNASMLETLIIPEGYKTILVTGANTINTGYRIKAFKLPSTIESVTLGNGMFQNTNLCSFTLNQGVKYVNIGTQVFYGTPIDEIIIPEGVEDLIINTTQTFYNCTRLKYIKIPVPTKSFSGIGLQSLGLQTELILELGNDWCYTIDVGSGQATYIPPYTAADMTTYIIDRLMDLRTTAGEIPYIKTTAGALAVWNAVKSDGSPLDGSAKFTQIFRVGQAVIVNIAGINRFYIIASINNDNQITMTGYTSMVAGTYILNHNKIVTFGTTLLARLSVEQKAIATNKLWQLL